MKIIDFAVYGNAVHFYLGEDDCNDYHGDDWDDAPYEHNAGTVYDDYVSDIADLYVDIDLEILTAESFYINSPFSKEDFKKRVTPCVVIAESGWGDDRKSIKFYFNDKMEPGRYFVNKEMTVTAF